ncbi:MAG: ABC transporter permease [Bacteroidales bacterium]
MVKHYLKLTFRHVRKHLLVSLLNISGLAIGIACFILIMLYVHYELRYDRFNTHFDNIYRVAVNAKIGNTVIRQTWTPAPMPAAMYDEFPEVEAITRIYDRTYTTRIGDQKFNEEQAAAVDSTFTEIFTLDIVEGAPGRMLNEPGQVLLDRPTARKYFGEETALGRVFYINDTIPLTVQGVFEEIPPQAHFHFNMLISLLTEEGQYNNPGWFANNFETYLLLKEGVPPSELEAKLPAFVDKYLFNGTYEENADDENFWELYLQHIRDIHLGSDLNGEFEPNGNLSNLRVFSVVAILVLIVACINFMNLTTASSSMRSREVGIRKTNGATRQKLRQQFYLEAIVVSLLALILAMGIVEGLMGSYRDFTGKAIRLQYLHNFLLIPGLLALSLVVGLLSGTYPALFMSRFSAVESLGYKGVRQAKSGFRNLLVLFQFSVSIFLIAATLLVNKQMDLIMEDSLGFDKEQVLVVNHAYYLDAIETISNELRDLPGVADVSRSAFIPGDKTTNWGFGAEGVEKNFSLNANLCDAGYLQTMGVELAEGRFFSSDRPGDVGTALLNETAVAMLELEHPLGSVLYLWNDRERPFEVIGVVKDYHWESKHMEVRPHVIMNIDVPELWRPVYLSVRYSGEPGPLLDHLETVWEKEVPAIPFEYEFLDEHYEAMYENEKQTRTLLYVFAGIAIFISCLGLFGLASFMAERRTKEIGIRKANGATTAHILRIVSVDFTKWVLLSNLLAWPLGWFLLHKWLQNFAYRVDIPWILFVVAGLLAFAIALLTVSFHAIRASRQNPGLSLRYE